MSANENARVAPLVGQHVQRGEDLRFATGQGRFVADHVSTTTLHAVFLRATQAAGQIRSIDTLAARDCPGVLAVLTGTDLAGTLAPIGALHEPNEAFVDAFSFQMADIAIPCLVTDRVHYVGEPVAVVVAESRAMAEDAAELIDVDYTPGTAVTTPQAALEPAAPRVHEHLPDNIAASLRGGFGDVPAASKGAAHRVTGRFRMGRHSGVPLECRGVVASWDPARGRVDVRTSTQVPHFVRTAICASTGWSVSEVHVSTPDVGGGFGPKANVYAEEVVIAYLARLLGREVAWLEDRAEHFVASAQGRDQHLDAELAVDSTGHIVSWSVEFLADVGAGSLWVAGITANTALHSVGAYRVPHFQVVGTAVYTNKTIVAQYRGAGRPEACFALERCLDMAAEAAGISRLEIRERNLLRAEELPKRLPLPYRDGVPITYDGADFRRCLRACEQRLPDDLLDTLRARYPGMYLGSGVATYVEATGRGPYESATVRLLADGTFEVGVGSACAGQSHETTFAQIAADALGVPMSAVRVRTGDTDAVADGIGSFASRSAVVGGSAVHRVCSQLRARARELVARCLGIEQDSEHEPTWSEVGRLLAPGGELAEQAPLSVTGTFEPPTVTWTMGAHLAVVGVAPETGIARVLHYVVAHEGGVEINPTVVLGQIRGGVAQGIGGILLEEFDYADDGQPATATFAEYLLPGSCDVPPVDVVHLPGPAQLNPIGVKGVGESGTIAVYAAVASAIEDALSCPAGTLTSTPVLPSTMLDIAESSVDASV
ncbi:carbon-monoxide dehydrogenase large subunit [Tamaricihabitans halophyticus]|uniref:Carbon-monoxide dehydrogenase large subunit n=1 Tax=Tamaricihabitans halophyticus TaxID=1262583 RepID=A0A4R2R7E9_9PSEU|nr:xanthine dehydrogenase family protein molybdopterin-binding subunit [Tamaricihabitans halophyticus]TCP55325.1 carbon-monoxide dehydrogenase large subunit [Tamaricihabitans halophyticus]